MRGRECVRVTVACPGPEQNGGRSGGRPLVCRGNASQRVGAIRCGQTSQGVTMHKRGSSTFAALLLAGAVFAGPALAQDKKELAFVVNGASDFWKLAEAGVK